MGEFPLLSQKEISQWVRRFRYDPEFRDQKTGSYTIPITSFCDYAGIARQNLYALIDARIALTKNYQIRLSQAIHDVTQGLRFRRKNSVYEIVGPFARLPRREWAPGRGVPEREERA